MSVRRDEELVLLCRREAHITTEERLHEPLDVRERGTELMGDGRHELVLQSVHLGLVRERALEPLVEQRVPQGDRDVVGERLEQLEVVLIERAEVVESVRDRQDAEQLIVRRHWRGDRVADPPGSEEAPKRLVADRPREQYRFATDATRAQRPQRSKGQTRRTPPDSAGNDRRAGVNALLPPPPSTVQTI